MTAEITTINGLRAHFFSEQEQGLVTDAFGEFAEDGQISLDEIFRFKDNPPEKMTPIQLDAIDNILRRHGYAYEEIIVHENDPVLKARQVVEDKLTDMGYRRKRRDDKIILVPPTGKAFYPTVVLDADDGFATLRRTHLRLRKPEDWEILMELLAPLEIGGLIISKRKLDRIKDEILGQIHFDIIAWQQAISHKHFQNKPDVLIRDLETFWYGRGTLNPFNDLGVLPSDMYLSPEEKRRIIEDYIATRTDSLEGKKMRVPAQSFLDNDATDKPNPEPPPPGQYSNNDWQQASYHKGRGEYDLAAEFYKKAAADDNFVLLYAIEMAKKSAEDRVEPMDINSREVRKLLLAGAWMCRQLSRAKNTMDAYLARIHGGLEKMAVSEQEKTIARLIHERTWSKRLDAMELVDRAAELLKDDGKLSRANALFRQAEVLFKEIREEEERIVLGLPEPTKPKETAEGLLAKAKGEYIDYCFDHSDTVSLQQAIDLLKKALSQTPSHKAKFEEEVWEVTRQIIFAINTSADEESQMEIVGLYLQYISYVTGVDRSELVKLEAIERVLKNIEVDGQVKNTNVVDALEGLAATFARLEDWRAAGSLYILCLRYEQRPEKITGLHETIGDLFIIIGEEQQALTAFTNALGRADSATLKARLHVKIAHILQNNGYFTEAITHLDAAILLEPSAALHVDKGKILLQRAELVEDRGEGDELVRQASMSFKEALKLDNKDEEAMYGVAFTYVHFGDINRALRRIYPALLKNNPTHVGLLVEAAELHEKVGHKQQALEYYSQAIARIPLNDQLMEAWDWFDRAQEALDAKEMLGAALDSNTVSLARQIREKYNIKGPQELVDMAMDYLLQALTICERRDILFSRIKAFVSSHAELQGATDQQNVAVLNAELEKPANPAPTQEMLLISQLYISKAGIYLKTQDTEQAVDSLLMAIQYNKNQEPLFSQIRKLAQTGFTPEQKAEINLALAGLSPQPPFTPSSVSSRPRP